MFGRRPIASLIATLLLSGTAPAPAGTVVTSATPDAVAVTIYRAPDRRYDQAMEADWLEGYALITETRTVAIPAGEAAIRFEGVAGGMLPESALVTGLPIGVSEKNLDADLLSPASLYARSFGRPVVLRREHKKTGKIVEERAVIRSGPDGSVILQTREGFEAANCGPLNDTLVYPGVPPGLAARPTLSVETSAPAPANVKLTLSYLAWGFDWQTNYVLRMHEGRKRADVSAWVTLASSDPTSFVDADTAVVGGRLNRVDDSDDAKPDPGDQELIFHCLFSPLPVPASPLALAEGYSGDIIVTAQRRSESLFSVPTTVTSEGLGDLKLYRVPMPTTVASQSIKQVMMFDKRDVKIALVYTGSVDMEGRASGVYRQLRTRNDEVDGLGIALPAGPIAILEPLHGEPMVIGKSGLRDLAVGELVRIPVPSPTSQVNLESRVDGRLRSYGPEDEGDDERQDRKHRQTVIIVTNANPWPIDFEARLPVDEEEASLDHASSKLARENGQPVWKVTVPANGTKRLRYRLTKIKTK